MYNKKVIAICGYSGSGKSFLTGFLKKQGYNVIRASEVVLSALRIKDVRKLSEEERLKKAGEVVKANPLLPGKILLKEASKLKGDVVLDGIKTEKDLVGFKDVFIIFIVNCFEKRFKLLKKYKNKTLTKKTLKKRDEFDKRLGLDKLRKKADLVLKNEDLNEDILKCTIKR